MLFTLVHHHNYSIADIENMIPYERDLFVDLIIADLEKKKKDLEGS